MRQIKTTGVNEYMSPSSTCVPFNQWILKPGVNRATVYPHPGKRFTRHCGSFFGFGKKRGC